VNPDPASDPNRYVLPVDAETNNEYPTRCSQCDRPVHKFALFPKGHCLTANDVIRAWGGRPI
jgi:hypothetical protein